MVEMPGSDRAEFADWKMPPEENKKLPQTEMGDELRIPGGIIDLLNGKDFDFSNTDSAKRGKEKRRWFMIVTKRFGGTLVDYKGRGSRLEPGKAYEFSAESNLDLNRFVEMEVGGKRILAPVPWLNIDHFGEGDHVINPFLLGFLFEDEFGRPVTVEASKEDFDQNYSRADLRMKSPAILTAKGQISRPGVMIIHDRSGKLTTVKE